MSASDGVHHRHSTGRPKLLNTATPTPARVAVADAARRRSSGNSAASAACAGEGAAVADSVLPHERTPGPPPRALITKSVDISAA